jgi:hypothetical protein
MSFVWRLLCDLLLVCVLLGITLISGLVRRDLAERWCDGSLDSAVLSPLEALPVQVGYWEARGMAPAPAPSEHFSGSYAVHRQYMHRETGHRIDVRLFVGENGGIWDHDLQHLAQHFGCDPSFELQSAAVTTRGFRETFWKIDLRGANDRLGVLYAWSDGGAWTAARIPGITFARRAYLYRLEMVVPDVSPPPDPGLQHRFFIDLLAAVRECLVEAPLQRLP